MRTVVGLAIVVVALAGLASSLFAQQKLEKLIIGKWQPVDEDKIKIIVEFTREGRLLVQVEDKQVKGTYRVLNDDEVEVSLQIEDKTVSEKLRVTINSDQMTTVDSKGKKDIFRRIK